MPVTRAHLELATVDGDGLRFNASNDKGRSIVLDSGPNSTSLDPMQALAAALGACTGMDVISILRKKRQAVTGYTLEVVGQRREEHPRSYTALEVVHRLRGRGIDPQAVADAIRLSEERYCSVSATLGEGLPITNRFEIADEA